MPRPIAESVPTPLAIDPIAPPAAPTPPPTNAPLRTFPPDIPAPAAPTPAPIIPLPSMA